MATMSSALRHPERDPALLAFIKCHMTSMTRWNVLRVLSQDPGYHWSVDEVARRAHGPGDGTRRSLEDLATEGLVERYDGPEGPPMPWMGPRPPPGCLPGCRSRPRATTGYARSSSPGCSKEMVPLRQQGPVNSV